MQGRLALNKEMHCKNKLFRKLAHLHTEQEQLHLSLQHIKHKLYILTGS